MTDKEYAEEQDMDALTDDERGVDYVEGADDGR
jgi:hypothetical protein